MALFDYLKSTIWSKVIMAVTGVLLVLFVTGHVVGNSLIYFGKEPFNAYAHFLQSLGEILWLIRITLLVALILHIITSISLKLRNLGAKPTKYEVKRYVKAKLSARTMIWTGIMIFAFITYHLLHFTFGAIDSENFSRNNPDYYKVEAVIAENEADEQSEGPYIEYAGKKMKAEDDEVFFVRPDAYSMVVKDFQNPITAIIYIIGVLLLGYHLAHAVESAFQTLGINHPLYNGFLRALGPVWAAIVALGFAAIPLSVLLGLVGG